jgi:hypothetical protein
MPRLGQDYTRQEIAAEHGGGIIEYLPHANGKVVCACLRLDYNPDAPTVVLPGHDPDVQHWASVLCEQGGSVPVYLKRSTNAWEYVGLYEVERWSQLPSEIAEHEARSGRGGKFGVSRVIHMRKASGD